MKYITLCTVDNSYEANFIKDNLADEGIVCIVTNEHFTTLMPHLNGMLGAGIQILVDIDDYERARQVVDKRTASDKSICPNCHSNRVGYGLGTRRRSMKIAALVIAVITGSPIQHIRRTYYCRDCRAEFGN